MVFMKINVSLLKLKINKKKCLGFIDFFVDFVNSNCLKGKCYKL